MARIQIIEGDITTARVDAIANATNPIMLGGGGVDSAIRGAYGYPLDEAAAIALATCNDVRYDELEILFYLMGEAIAAWETALSVP